MTSQSLPVLFCNPSLIWDIIFEHSDSDEPNQLRRYPFPMTQVPKGDLLLFLGTKKGTGIFFVSTRHA